MSTVDLMEVALLVVLLFFSLRALYRGCSFLLLLITFARREETNVDLLVTILKMKIAGSVLLVFFGDEWYFDFIVEQQRSSIVTVSVEVEDDDDRMEVYEKGIEGMLLTVPFRMRERLREEMTEIVARQEAVRALYPHLGGDA